MFARPRWRRGRAIAALPLGLALGCGGSEPAPRTPPGASSGAAPAAAAPRPTGTPRQRLVESALEVSELDEDQGRWESALALVDAVAADLRAGDAEPALLARALARRGSLLVVKARRVTGDYAAALSALEEARALAERAGDRRAIAAALEDIGLAHYIRRAATGEGDYGDARRAFERALALREKAGDRDGAAESLFHLGLVAEVSGNRKEAWDRYHASISIAERTRDRQRAAAVRRHFGSLYESSNELDKALREYEKSLALVREAKQRSALAPALAAVGDTLYALKRDPSKALPYLNEALAVANDLGDKAHVASVRRSLGDIARGRGDAPAAAEHYRAALAAAEAARDKGVAESVRASMKKLGKGD